MFELTWCKRCAKNRCQPHSLCLRSFAFGFHAFIWGTLCPITIMMRLFICDKIALKKQYSITSKSTSFCVLGQTIEKNASQISDLIHDIFAEILCCPFQVWIMLQWLYHSLRGKCLIDFFVSMHPLNIHQPLDTYVITKRASVQRINVCCYAAITFWLYRWYPRNFITLLWLFM